MRINVISDRVSNRLNYVFEYLFSDFEDIQMVVSDRAEPERGDLIISYGRSNMDGARMYIPPSDFLKPGFFSGKEEDFLPDWNHIVDRVEKGCYHLKADLPGIVFFFLSRMEEYHFSSSDYLERFCATDSILNRKGLADIAVVDRMKNRWNALLIQICPELSLRPAKPTILASCDIDVLYAYHGKSFLKILAGGLRELIQWDLNAFSVRMQYLFGRSQDPFFSFHYLLNLSESLDVRLKAFILCPHLIEFSEDRGGEQLSEFADHKLRKLFGKMDVGLHPSVSAADNVEKISLEKEKLEMLLQVNLTKSRQHYLRMRFPDTYRALLKAGIKEDFSMGFHDGVGFRAGTSRPFYWYDLEREKTTDLLVHPLVLMDVALKNHMDLKPRDAKEKIRILIKEIKETNGNFSYLWHNSSISGPGKWNEWISVLEFMVEELLISYDFQGDLPDS